jgi:hypothetical protein
MWRPVDIVRTDVLEELVAPVFKIEISEQGTALAVALTIRGQRAGEGMVYMGDE